MAIQPNHPSDNSVTIRSVTSLLPSQFQVPLYDKNPVKRVTYSVTLVGVPLPFPHQVVVSCTGRSVMHDVLYRSFDLPDIMTEQDIGGYLTDAWFYSFSDVYPSFGLVHLTGTVYRVEIHQP